MRLTINTKGPKPAENPPSRILSLFFFYAFLTDHLTHPFTDARPVSKTLAPRRYLRPGATLYSQISSPFSTDQR